MQFNRLVTKNSLSNHAWETIAGNKKTLLFFVVFKNNVYLCSVY